MASQLSKLCCTNVLYKALENLDAIALSPVCDVGTTDHQAYSFITAIQGTKRLTSVVSSYTE